MPRNKKKVSQLTKLKTKQYKIFGIFDFKLNKLVHVSMDVDLTETEFDIGDYDAERFDIVSFKVSLT